MKVIIPELCKNGTIYLFEYCPVCDYHIDGAYFEDELDNVFETCGGCGEEFHICTPRPLSLALQDHDLQKKKRVRK